MKNKSVEVKKVVPSPQEEQTIHESSEDDDLFGELDRVDEHE